MLKLESKAKSISSSFKEIDYKTDLPLSQTGILLENA